MFVSSNQAMIKSYVDLSNKDAAEGAFIEWFEQASGGGQKMKEAACALWIASTCGNQRLIRYIVRHSDNKIVNAYMNKKFLLCSAWNPIPSSWEHKTEKSLHQSMECAHLLIDAGANVNAKHWNLDRKGNFHVSIPPNTNLRNFTVVNTTPNLLGHMVLMLINTRHKTEEAVGATIETREAKIKEQIIMGALLIAHGAKIEIAAISKSPSKSDTPEENKKLWEDYNFKVVNEMASFFWEKTRLVYLAKKSQTSTFAEAPVELMSLIGQNVIELSFLQDETSKDPSV